MDGCIAFSKPFNWYVGTVSNGPPVCIAYILNCICVWLKLDSEMNSDLLESVFCKFLENMQEPNSIPSLKVFHRSTLLRESGCNVLMLVLLAPSILGNRLNICDSHCGPRSAVMVCRDSGLPLQLVKKVVFTLFFGWSHENYVQINFMNAIPCFGVCMICLWHVFDVVVILT